MGGGGGVPVCRNQSAVFGLGRVGDWGGYVVLEAFFGGGTEW